MHLDPSRASSALVAGERVGDYVVDAPLAAGGFGVIYRAKHAIERTPAALKVLHAELASAPGAVLRFEREIDVVQRLHHPNIVDIYTWGRLPDGRPYFVMELLSGITLDASIQLRGRMFPDEVLGILEPLCTALAVVHEHGVIHRDLSPSNVFLAEDGGSRRVVLLDFGVAKLLDGPAQGLTTPSRPVGTPACMAPEQIRMQQTTPQTDVYALGVLTYMMLTGQLPFNDPSLMVMHSMHLYVTPAKPSAVAPISPAFDGVVLGALSKRPDHRYGSPLDLFTAFQAALAQENTPRSLGSGVRRAVALAIEIIAGSEAPEDDDDILSDIEAIPALAARLLGERGFEVMARAGNIMLLGLYLPSDRDGERSKRLFGIEAARALHHELARRATLDPRVHVNVCLHAGEARTLEESISDGDLWDTSSWTPQGRVDGVTASAAALEGLQLTVHPLDEGGRLFRL
jgi:eukaryotic-like serine/threonine-protein kinase